MALTACEQTADWNWAIPQNEMIVGRVLVVVIVVII
jgi:hypothetical protein